MNSFPPLPLGQRIPASPHAVSCSLPTMRDVRGYEEKDPAVMRHVTSAYPRFVVHHFTQKLAAHLLSAHGLADHTLWLVSSARMAGRLADHLGAAHVTRVVDGDIHGIAHPANPALAARAKLFLQNIGGFLSSRAAEDRLVHHGLLPAAAPEALFDGNALAGVKRHLLPTLTGASADDLFLASCGMNAVYAAFRAVADLQAARGRTLWIQLGWLYLDTIAILKRFAPSADDYVYVRDVLDHVALERLFHRFGHRIAGVVSEVPTNPLIQTPDVAALAGLCRRHGARLILDPSVASGFDVDVLPHADVVVCSLTKYTASEGDLVAGSVAVNPTGPDAASLRRIVAANVEPLYARDLARLAHEIGETHAVLARIHANTAAIVAYLEKHPAVGEVHWALHAASRDNFRRIARAPDATGGMITFTLREVGSLEKVYDRLRLPKGPSFGMKTTLICPFMYLAHYDLVTTPAGLAELAASKLDPDLLRLCVGTEPVAEIIAALDEALA